MNILHKLIKNIPKKHLFIFCYQNITPVGQDYCVEIHRIKRNRSDIIIKIQSIYTF